MTEEAGHIDHMHFKCSLSKDGKKVICVFSGHEKICCIECLKLFAHQFIKELKTLEGDDDKEPDGRIH